MKTMGLETAIDLAAARVRSYNKAHAVTTVKYVAGYVRAVRTKRGGIYVEIRDNTGNVTGVRNIEPGLPVKRKYTVKSRVWRPLGWLERLVSWLRGVRFGD